jgi:hypothetical protein
LQVDGLGGNGTRCLQTDNTGLIAVAGAGCGGGSGDSITVNSSAATDANLLDVAATGSVTGTTWTLDTAPTPDNITLAISNASATVAGSVTTGTQTFAGDKTFTGNIVYTQTVSTSGSPTNFLITGAAHTTLAISTEAPDINFNLNRTVQFTGSATPAAANIATQRAIRIQAPTYAFSSSGAQTITDAASLAIGGEPTSGTNATITNSHGLLIETRALTSTTNGYGLTVNAPTAATNSYAAQFLGGSVGIGESAPAQRLTVTNGSILNKVSAMAPTTLGGADLGATSYSVAFQGKYAYTSVTAAVAGTCSGSTVTGCEFRIYDIHNPSSPTAVGGVDVGNFISGVKVSGQYAYVAVQNAGSSSVNIYDVSNPSSPTSTGTVSLNAIPWTIGISGKYLYVGLAAIAGTCSTTTATGCEFRVYDISNPASPAYMGGKDTNDDDILALQVVGKYAYITTGSDGGTCSGATITGCEVKIYDLSTPSVPSAVGGFDIAQPVYNLYVAGKYLYYVQNTNTNTCSGTTVIGCEFGILDISNPSAPAGVRGVNTGQLSSGVVVSGKYAFTTNSAVGGTCSATLSAGCELRMYDISDPATAITFVGGLDFAITTDDVEVYGKYVHVTLDSVSGNDWRIIDVAGIDAPSASIGTLASNNIVVTENANIANNLYIGAGLQVGITGIYSYGPVAIKGNTNGEAFNAIQGIATTGSPTGFSFVAGAHTTLSNAEASDVYYDLSRTVQFGQNTTLALQRAFLIDAPTYSSSAATKTMTDVATLGITGAPVEGSNTSVTNSHALLISGGAATGATNAYGLTVNAPTGATNNYAAQFVSGSDNLTINMSAGDIYYESTNAFQKFYVNTTAIMTLDTGGVRTFVALKLDLPGTGTGNALCHATQAGTTNEEVVDCTSAPAADYSENYPTAADVTEGDIVMPTKTMVTTTQGDKVAVLTKADSALDLPVLGVVSRLSDVSDFNNIGNNIDKADNPMPVALNGRVLVKVTEENGSIEIGDKLTLSKTLPGYAMKQTTTGDSIGYALEPSRSGADKIMAFLKLGYAKVQVATNAEGQLVNTADDTDFAGSALLNVKSIASIGGKWSIDELGNLVVETIKAKQLCLGETCVNEYQLKQILQGTGVRGQGSEVTQTVTPPAESTETPPSTEVTQPETSTQNQATSPDPTPPPVIESTTP